MAESKESQHYQDLPFQKQLLHLCPLSCIHASIVEGNTGLQALLQLTVAADGSNPLHLVMVASVSYVAPPLFVDHRHQVHGCVHSAFA